MSPIELFKEWKKKELDIYKVITSEILNTDCIITN